MNRLIFFLFLISFSSFFSLADINDTTSKQYMPPDSLTDESVPMTYASNDVEVPLPEQSVWPESPRTMAIRQVMMPSSSIVTGACVFSIPLYTIEVEDFKLPLSLQYRSNGIKPTDDPQPFGYGWVLTPPMRISRQIKGRPDEYFTFVGDKGENFVTEDYEKGYACVRMDGATQEIFSSTRYDTERDIFTIYLIDQTLTMIYKDGTLHGVDCGEYRFECGKLLSYIKVTDPKGITYNFGLSGERIGYGNMRTEWLLTSITLQSGSEISINWQLSIHSRTRLYTYGPSTLYYNDTNHPYAHANSVLTTAPTERHVVQNTHDLADITFPGGKLECSYKTGMMESMTVSNNKKNIYNARFIHEENSLLLTSVIIQNSEKYSFEYNPTTFKRGDMVDWWGFYNGKDNHYQLSPTIKTVSTINRGDIIYGADRTIDRDKMKACILTKATYPTGGYVKWEYEPHKFKPQTVPYWVSRYIVNEQPLSEGGGLRVTSITMKESPTAEERVKKYIYGNNGDGMAVVTAVPGLHTFITESPHLCLRYDYSIFLTIDKCITVNLHSDYLTGENGNYSIWYDHVTEIDSEGKTEYTFEKLTPKNIGSRLWGEVYPWEIYDVFSKGPVETSRIIYKSDSSGYTTVEKTENIYNLNNNTDLGSIENFTIKRKCLVLYPSDYAPDYGSARYRMFYLMGWQHEAGEPTPPEYNGYLVDRDDMEWFEGVDYGIIPYSEQLVGKKVTYYFDNLHRVINERYEYLPGTSLITTKVISDGTDSIKTEFSYNDCFNTDIDMKMKARNICGIVTGIRETFGTSTIGYSMEMAQFGSTFRPTRIWRERGNTRWNNGIYEYDTKGRLTKYTTMSGNLTQWTRDIYGNPLKMVTGSGLMMSKATWEHLVGVTSLSIPSGTTYRFTYDESGRLTESFLNNKIQSRHSYHINQDGTSNIASSFYTSEEKYFGKTEFFDGLGRPWLTQNQQPDGTYLTSLSEFDIMDRPLRKWTSVAMTSASPSAENIKNAAVNYYNDDFAYTSYAFEPSQRELPTSSVRPGRVWHSEGKSIEVRNYTNQLRAAYSCPKYKVTDSGVEFDDNYQQGSLTIEETIDEDGITVETYKDLRGQIVARKENGLMTAFVYDNYGDLRYILPPGLSGTHKRTDPEMQQLAYWYDYDSRGRTVTRKLPGVKAARYLYDPADRLVAEHSAHHASGIWRFYGYDRADRLVLAVDCPVTDEQAITFASICRTASLDFSGTLSGYMITGIPTSAQIVWAKYYDNYQFIAINSLDDEFKWTAPSQLPAYNSHGGSLGLLTGVYTGQGFESYHYNSDGNLMQRYATGFNRGRQNIFYGYDGQPIKTESVYTSEGWPDLTSTIVYDDAGRVTSTSVTQGTDTSGYTASTTSVYNSIGQLSEITLGTATRSFTYDIHGWLKSSQTKVGNKQLSETLHYADGVNPCYNGNISAKQLPAGRYDYSYDKNNRLIMAKYSGDGSDSDFSASYSYDDRGNIISLTRKGIIDKAGGSETFGLLDDLTISYSGNQLKSVSASTEALPFDGITGVSQNRSDMSLSYDASGRVCADETRGISSMEYDNDGHPVRIIFESGNEQRDIWDGFGNHIATEYYDTGSMEGKEPFVTKRYAGDGQIEYQIGPDIGIPNKIMVYTAFPGGYFDQDGAPHYYITDYQGNNIAIVNSDLEITEENNYYPYGEPWRDKGGMPFLFSGNERLLVDGLNEYDFHARRYNAAIPAFTSWDACNEQYPWLSPYAYAAGNPINLIDPSGNKVRPYGIDELEMIRNTLPFEIRESVVIDKYGFIDADALNSVNSDDVNVNALKRLVNDDLTIDVKLDNVFEFVNTFGSLDSQKMSYSPYEEEYSIEKDINGITPGGTSTGEEGFLGKTLFPDRIGLQNSPDYNIKIIVNKSLSPAGAAEIYSHEANGHALLYITSFYNHIKASHQFLGSMDLNKTLVNMIIESKQATIRNMKP